jgi:signal transduction histidine kinase
MLAGLFLTTVVYWSAVGILTARFNEKEANELYDIHLSHTGVALLRLVLENQEPPTPLSERLSEASIDQLFQKWPDFPERVVHGLPAVRERVIPISPAKQAADPDVVAKNVKHGRTMRYQLWRNGHLVFKSTNAPTTPITELPGFSSDRDTYGKVWRNYSVWDVNHELLALVSEPEEARIDLVRSLSILYINPFLLGMPVFIFLIWMSVNSGLSPLNDLSKAIAKSNARSLVPIDSDNSPRELKPMVLALNHLIDRVAQALDAERRFNANTAHELNTPLAAIQAHLYVARQSQNDAERQQALNQAHIATERSIRLISQMLALARLGSEQAYADMQSVNLNDIAQDVCAELMPLAMRRDQTLEILTAAGSTVVMGQADLLHRLISNLVDNAMRYSPQHSQIQLEIGQAMNGVRLTVSDNGPGIPLAQREHVFDRFFRLADQSARGTGLGLAICRKIAMMHLAEISLSEGPDGTGLSVHVDFPSGG